MAYAAAAVLGLTPSESGDPGAGPAETEAAREPHPTQNTSPATRSAPHVAHFVAMGGAGGATTRALFVGPATGEPQPTQNTSPATRGTPHVAQLVETGGGPVTAAAGGPPLTAMPAVLAPQLVQNCSPGGYSPPHDSQNGICVPHPADLMTQRISDAGLQCSTWFRVLAWVDFSGEEGNTPVWEFAHGGIFFA